jgi:hypothetical protein
LETKSVHGTAAVVVAGRVLPEHLRAGAAVGVVDLNTASAILGLSNHQGKEIGIQIVENQLNTQFYRN